MGSHAETPTQCRYFQVSVGWTLMVIVFSHVLLLSPHWLDQARIKHREGITAWPYLLFSEPTEVCRHNSVWWCFGNGNLSRKSSFVVIATFVSSPLASKCRLWATPDIYQDFPDSLALVTQEALLSNPAPCPRHGFQSFLVLCAHVCGNVERSQIYLHLFIPSPQRSLLRVISEVIVIFLISGTF